MTDYILISELNDYIFCPYSIYLHNVYQNTDEGLFHAAPQTIGKMSHETVDKKTGSNRSDYIFSLPIYSEEFGLMGKIDLYKSKDKTLIERKYQISRIFQGQIYQLWAQMLCLKEMHYEVEQLFIYEISKKQYHPIPMPTEEDIVSFRNFLDNFRSFDPSRSKFPINKNKCQHCIYCNLCDKTIDINVYT